MVFKRISASVLAALLVFSCSLPVFAAVAPVKVPISSVTGLDQVFRLNGSYHSIGTLPIAHFSEADREKWLQLMSDLQGENPDRCALVSVFVDKSGSIVIRFFSFNFNSVFSGSLSTSGANSTLYFSVSSLVGFSFLFPAGYRSGDAITSSIIPSNQSISLSFSNASDSLARFIIVAQIGYDFTSLSHVNYKKPVYYTDEIASLQIVDDVTPPELPEPPTPSEPDVPPLPPTPPKDVEIPVGDPKYVPYDTSIWKRFLDHVRGNIGSAVNVGLLIFAAIMGVYIIKRVVDSFSRVR